MECHQGHLHDVDEPDFPAFLNIIKPFISDPNRYERLQQGFPPPRAITLGPCHAPPGYKKLFKPRPSPHTQNLPQSKAVRKRVLQRIEVPQRRHSPSPTSTRPSRKRRWLAPSPSRHSSCARNLREVETRIRELEREIQRLTPRITAAASKLQALRESVAQLKRGQ